MACDICGGTKVDHIGRTCRSCGESELTEGPLCASVDPQHEGDVVTLTVEAVVTGRMALVPLCERHRGAR